MSPPSQPRWTTDADPEPDEPAAPHRPFSLLDLFPIPSHPLQLVLGVVALVALFFAGYVGVLIAARILQGGSAYTQAISALSQAQQREREAMGQNDPVVRRHLLEMANQLASQALKQRPDDALTITTAGRIEREYRAASGIAILPVPTTLVDLPSPADRLIVRGTDVYALDRANSRLYRYLLSADGTTIQAGANPTVVQQGDHIGPVTVGKLTAAAWMPSGPDRSGAGLVALDSSGFLIKYDPTLGLGTLRLRDPGSWNTVIAVAAHEGKLFALNAAQQTLAWYPSQPGGYDGPVYNYLGAGVTANLSDAVDLAVDDGLYLLHANGQVQKFVDGKPVAFAGPPADLTPSHPSGLALSNDSVYVGDPEHARILQLARDGTYRRVLTSDGNATILAHLRDLAVPDGASAIYVLADAKIYRFSLPELRP